MERRTESEAQVADLYPPPETVAGQVKRLLEPLSINSNGNGFIMAPLIVVCMSDIC